MIKFEFTKQIINQIAASFYCIVMILPALTMEGNFLIAQASAFAILVVLQAIIVLISTSKQVTFT